MNSSTDVEVTVVDRLSWETARAESVKAAIRSALQGVRGGPWVVILGPQAFADSLVSVSVRGPNSVTLTSFALDATVPQIEERLVAAMQTAD
jgi:hypothetical protein